MENIRIKYSDIVRNMSMVLNEHFPQTPIMNVVKDHHRPCFFTRLDVDSTGTFMTRHIDSTIAFRIYYYPSTSEKTAEYELLEMRDELEYLFLVKHNRLLNIDNKINIEIHDIGVGEVEGVLHFYVFMYLSQAIIDTTEYDTMEHLEIQREVHNIHICDKSVENKKE